VRGQPLVTGSAETRVVTSGVVGQTGARTTVSYCSAETQVVTSGVVGQTGARTTVSYSQCRDTSGDKWCGWTNRCEDNG